MKIERLSLRNFRNVGDAYFDADPRLNFLVGKNGQGKTSFLEAIGYLALLRSFRGAKSDEVVRWGQPASEISATISPEGDESSRAYRSELKIRFEPPVPGTSGRSKKTASINGKAYGSSSQYLTQRFGNFSLGFHSVVFNPADHYLLRGEPSERRTFLDRVLAAEDEEFLNWVSKYARVLEQRNRLLKDSDGRPQESVLLGFTEPLVHLGARITHRRLEWLKRVSAPLQNTAKKIAPEQPEMRVILLSNWCPETQGLSFSNKDLDPRSFSGQGPLPSVEILEQSFWNQLSLMRDAEVRSRTSNVGPHRDDWTFYFGDQPLKGHGSQGEMRSALLALKLSEIVLFREKTGHRPVLLLDDFSSELDRERREFLLRFLLDSDLQVFVTTTEDSIGLGRRFVVRDGGIRQVGNDNSAERSQPVL